LGASKQDTSAHVSKEEALRRAQDYLNTRKIDVSKMSMVGAYYSRFPDVKNNSWTFIWAPSTNIAIFDAEIRVYVRDDGSVSHGGGA
jgi:hypothetical protein